ncbi:hypothetical protein M9H77_34534 [Catharanthus roseus]|uniref:Uncharacterized protein n=1 Tax=Catharanthus roseus TaxID=4058 RepID=A0ACB9ZLF9_CATRO|nr:hypothetical protein M9H77_34534 [Catharanthus roseus]
MTLTVHHSVERWGILAAVRVVPSVVITGVAALLVLKAFAFDREEGGCHWSRVGATRAACTEANPTFSTSSMPLTSSTSAASIAATSTLFGNLGIVLQNYDGLFSKYIYILGLWSLIAQMLRSLPTSKSPHLFEEIRRCT